MNKFAEAVTVTETAVSVAAVELTSYQDREALTQAIRSGFHRRSLLLQQARITKGCDPATYGLEKDQRVTIGKGKQLWTLHSIRESWRYPGEFEAILYTADSAPVGPQSKRIDVRRLVPANVE